MCSKLGQDTAVPHPVLDPVELSKHIVICTAIKPASVTGCCQAAGKQQCGVRLHWHNAWIL